MYLYLVLVKLEYAGKNYSMQRRYRMDQAMEGYADIHRY